MAKSFEDIIGTKTAGVKSFDEIVASPRLSQPQEILPPISGGLKEPQQEFIRKSPTFLRFRAQYLKERKKTKDTLVEQIGLSAYNKLIAIPAHEIAKSDLDAAGIKAHQIQTERMKKRKKEGHRRFTDQWLEDEWKEIRNELYLQPEARDEDLRTYPVFNKPGEDINPLAAQVEASKPVDVGTSIGAFVAQLALLKKTMPAAPPEMVWETQSLLTGGKPGEGAATFAAFSLPSKLLPGASKLSKAGVIAGESATLGAMAAIESKVDTGEISWESVAVGAGIPLALRTPKAIKAMIRARNPKVMNYIAKAHPELLERLPKQRDIVGKKPRIRIEGQLGKKITDGSKTVDVMKYNVDKYGTKKLPQMFQDWKKSPRVQEEFSGLTKSIDNKALEPTLWETFNRELASGTYKPKPIETIESVNKAVAGWVSKAKKLNETVRKQKVHEFRKGQAARIAERYRELRKSGMPRYKALIESRKAGGGKADIPEVEPLGLTPEQQDVYARKIEQVYGKNKPFQMSGATFALDKMQHGHIPTKYEFGLLEPILGFDTTKKLYDTLAHQKDYGIWKYPELIRDGWKAIRFGLDPQTARQLSKTKYRHLSTYYKSLWINIKSIFSKRQHNTIRKAIEADPVYKLGKKEYGLNYLSVAPWSSHEAGTKLQQYGRLADVLLKRKSPTLRFFGRWLHNAEIGADLGTNHALNRLTEKAEKDLTRYADRMAKRGKPLSVKQKAIWRRQRGKQINIFTKRLVAKNPKAVEIQRAANWILFSPAYTVSPPVADISGVVRLITGKGIANKTYGMQLILSQLSALTAMSGALSYFGLKARAANPTEEPPVDSSVNPLNTLWGKGRVGNDVFDLSFGDVAPYRLLARIGVSSYLEAQRLLTGKEQRTVAGKKVPTSGEAFLQYMNSKQTLWLGVAKTLLTKKDWLGNPIDLKGTVIENLPFEFFQSFVDAGASDGIWEDMAAGQDIDAAKKAIGNIPVSVASLGGIGTLTYPVPAYQTQKKFKDIVAKNNYGKVWDDLTPREQGKLQSQHREQFDMFAEKIRAERVEKPESMERIKEEQFKSGQKIRGLLSKKNKKLMKDIDVTVSRRPKDFYLNDERYQKYQELTAQYINERMDKIDLTFISDRRRVLLLKNIVKNAKNRAYATLRREMK